MKQAETTLIILPDHLDQWQITDRVTSAKFANTFINEEKRKTTTKEQGMLLLVYKYFVMSHFLLIAVLYVT